MQTSILLAAGAAVLLAMAPGAHAQIVEPANATPATIAPAPDSGNWTLKQREDWLNDRINKAHDGHDIDGREADRAHHALDRLRDEENKLRGDHDGQLTDNETQMLEARLDDMAAQIHWLHENAFQRPW
jgi:hypothetical protein